jgi:hypothetical protein
MLFGDWRYSHYSHIEIRRRPIHCQLGTVNKAVEYLRGFSFFLSLFPFAAVAKICLSTANLFTIFGAVLFISLSLVPTDRPTDRPTERKREEEKGC